MAVGSTARPGWLAIRAFSVIGFECAYTRRLCPAADAGRADRAVACRAAAFYPLAALRTEDLRAASTERRTQRGDPADDITRSVPMTITTTASGLRLEDLVVGSGDTAAPGQQVRVHYTGWLYENDQAGRKFDSSKDRGEPFDFSLGAGHVIRGWDEGVVGMKVGGTRRLVIPAELGYGARGAGGVIPPNATLLFEVELLGV
jgi:FKBP-type peptidyl-prolyl cis-trans isomerase FkpA